MKFKLNCKSDSKVLKNNLDIMNNSVLKKAVVDVLDGEAGGWVQHSSYTKFRKAVIIEHPV